jgi:hypothetical protein
MGVQEEQTMNDRKAQIKLVAVADIQLKAGQEIDATITITESGIATSEIAKDLVMMCFALPDPSKPTGLAAVLGEMVGK